MLGILVLKGASDSKPASQATQRPALTVVLVQPASPEPLAQLDGNRRFRNSAPDLAADTTPPSVRGINKAPFAAASDR